GDAGLRGHFRASEDSIFPEGIVVRTEPAANAPIEPQGTVDYWLASGRALIPDVRGQPIQRAYQILNEAGFRSVFSGSPIAIGQPGRVIRQAPLQNTAAPIGTIITLTAGRAVPWLWIAGAILLVTAVAWLASVKRPPKPPSPPPSPPLGGFEVFLETE